MIYYRQLQDDFAVVRRMMQNINLFEEEDT